MNIPPFDEDWLIRKLNQLSGRSRAAFALLAAIRILPCYRCFALKTGAGDPDRLQALAEVVWKGLLTPPSPEDLEAVSLTAEDLVPSEDSSWEAEVQPYAEDAAASVAYAAACLATGSSQEAAWAGRRVYEAVDYFSKNRLSSPASSAEEVVRINSHPWVQEELERQHQDLRDLARWESTGSPRGVLEKLREKSEEASHTSICGFSPRGS